MDNRKQHMKNCAHAPLTPEWKRYANAGNRKVNISNKLWINVSPVLFFYGIISNKSIPNLSDLILLRGLKRKKRKKQPLHYYCKSFNCIHFNRQTNLMAIICDILLKLEN